MSDMQIHQYMSKLMRYCPPDHLPDIVGHDDGISISVSATPFASLLLQLQAFVQCLVVREKKHSHFEGKRFHPHQFFRASEGGIAAAHDLCNLCVRLPSRIVDADPIPFLHAPGIERAQGHRVRVADVYGENAVCQEHWKRSGKC